MTWLIETPRLGLRDITQDDLDLVWRLAQTPEVVRHMDYIAFKTKEAAAEWIENCVTYHQAVPRESYNLVIIQKNTGMPLGWIGIGEPDEPNKGDMDFGYALLPEHWRQGYATEALEALLAYTFAHHPIACIYGECDIQNKGSIRVMQKVGMQESHRYQDVDAVTGATSLTVGFCITRQQAVAN